MEDQLNFVFDIWGNIITFSAICNCTVVRPGEPDIVADKLVIIIKPPN